MIAQPSDTDVTGISGELTQSRFSRIFCTEPEGPINALVLEEERLRSLAGEMAMFSPELAALLASAGR